MKALKKKDESQREKTKNEKQDLVNHPSHYISSNGLETIEVIEGTLDNQDRFVGYLWGNIIKYISRWPHKGGVQDLKKAVWYIQALINFIEKKEKHSKKKRR